MTPGTTATADAGAPILELRGIRKSYGIGTPVETEVLHGIDLTLGEHEFVALTGPSGSGKSTLLNLIGLLETPTQGALRIAGDETTVLDDTALTRLRGRAIGFVFQFHHLLPAFSALENVMMPAIIHQGIATDEATARAEELLAAVGLAGAGQKKPGELSGGMQQRVAIARALITDPVLIVADEPTGDLDRESAHDILRLLQRLNRELGKTIVMVTHDPHAAGHAHAIMHLEKGALSAREELGDGVAGGLSGASDGSGGAY